MLMNEKKNVRYSIFQTPPKLTASHFSGEAESEKKSESS